MKTIEGICQGRITCAIPDDAPNLTCCSGIVKEVPTFEESKEEYDRLVSYALELRNKKRKRKMLTPKKNQCSLQYQLVNGVFYYLLTSEEYPYILAKHEEIKEAMKSLDNMIDKNRLGDDDEF